MSNKIAKNILNSPKTSINIMPMIPMTRKSIALRRMKFAPTLETNIFLNKLLK